MNERAEVPPAAAMRVATVFAARSPRRSVMFAPLAAAAVAAILSVASSAGADAPPPRTSSLAWVRLPGAEACIDARALAEAVELRLARPAFVAATRGDVAIEARIEPIHSPDGWRATLTVIDPAGARVGFRELVSGKADCRSIDGELELVLALLIDPNAVLTPPAASAPPVVPAPPVASAPAVSRGPSAPPAVSRGPSAPPAMPPLCPAPAVCSLPPPAQPWRVGAEAGPIAGLGFQARALLDASVSKLDDDKRAVFVLFELEELSMTEVAEAVGCPLQTAYARLYAARRTVEAALRRATAGREAT